MSNQFATDGKLGINVSQVDDVSSTNQNLNFPKGQQPLGTKFEGANGGTWIYCSLPAITQIGSVCVIDPTTWLATLASTANSPFGQRLGVAPAVASLGNYGWLQTEGVIDNVYVLASCAANVRLNTTATAGALDDDGTAGAKVANNLTLTTARAASNGVAPGQAGSETTVGATL